MYINCQNYFGIDCGNKYINNRVKALMLIISVKTI